MIADWKKPLRVGILTGLGVDEVHAHFQGNKKPDESALNERAANHLGSVPRKPLRELSGKRTDGSRCSAQGFKIEPKFPVMARFQLKVTVSRLQQTGKIFPHCYSSTGAC